MGPPGMMNSDVPSGTLRITFTVRGREPAHVECSAEAVARLADAGMLHAGYYRDKLAELSGLAEHLGWSFGEDGVGPLKP